eukprot:753168-Alexandrium_andersonii.AAC.1
MPGELQQLAGSPKSMLGERERQKAEVGIDAKNSGYIQAELDARSEAEQNGYAECAYKGKLKHKAEVCIEAKNSGYK